MPCSSQPAALAVDAVAIAAAQAATPGHPYERLVASYLAAPAADAVTDVPDPTGEDALETDGSGVRITREPGTGDALTEMIATLDAQRAFEASASMFDIGKRLAERTLDIGR